MVAQRLAAVRECLVVELHNGPMGRVALKLHHPQLDLRCSAD